MCLVDGGGSSATPTSHHDTVTVQRALSLVEPTSTTGAAAVARRSRRSLRHRADRKYRDDDVIKTGNMAATGRRMMANARERRRMTMLNEAFDQLRAAVVPVVPAVVPLVTSDRKLSKYDTLKLAQFYISALVDLLALADISSSSTDDNLLSA